MIHDVALHDGAGMAGDMYGMTDPRWCWHTACCVQVTTQTNDDLSDDDDDEFESLEPQEQSEGPKVLTADSSDSGDVGKGGIGRLWEPEEPEEDMVRCIGAAKPKVRTHRHTPPT